MVVTEPTTGPAPRRRLAAKIGIPMDVAATIMNSNRRQECQRHQRAVRDSRNRRGIIRPVEAITRPPRELDACQWLPGLEVHTCRYGQTITHVGIPQVTISCFAFNLDVIKTCQKRQAVIPAASAESDDLYRSAHPIRKKLRVDKASSRSERPASIAPETAIQRVRCCTRTIEPAMPRPKNSRPRIPPQQNRHYHENGDRKVPILAIVESRDSSCFRASSVCMVCLLPRLIGCIV